MSKPLTAKYRDELIAERDAARAEVERLLTLSALRWSPEVVRPDVPPPKSGERDTEGFIARLDDRFGGANVRMQRACSSAFGHGVYEADYDKPLQTHSQHAIRISSTRAHALRVLRCEKEAEFARRLRSIDAAIAAEVAREGQEAAALTKALSC